MGLILATVIKVQNYFIPAGTPIGVTLPTRLTAVNAIGRLTFQGVLPTDPRCEWITGHRYYLQGQFSSNPAIVNPQELQFDELMWTYDTINSHPIGSLCFRSDSSYVHAQALSRAGTIMPVNMTAQGCGFTTLDSYFTGEIYDYNDSDTPAQWPYLEIERAQLPEPRNNLEIDWHIIFEHSVINASYAVGDVAIVRKPRPCWSYLGWKSKLSDEPKWADDMSITYVASKSSTASPKAIVTGVYQKPSGPTVDTLSQELSEGLGVTVYSAAGIQEANDFVSRMLVSADSPYLVIYDTNAYPPSLRYRLDEPPVSDLQRAVIVQGVIDLNQYLLGMLGYVDAALNIDYAYLPITYSLFNDFYSAGIAGAGATGSSGGGSSRAQTWGSASFTPQSASATGPATNVVITGIDVPIAVSGINTPVAVGSLPITDPIPVSGAVAVTEVQSSVQVSGVTSPIAVQGILEGVEVNAVRQVSNVTNVANVQSVAQVSGISSVNSVGSVGSVASVSAVAGVSAIDMAHPLPVSQQGGIEITSPITVNSVQNAVAVAGHVDIDSLPSAMPTVPVQVQNSKLAVSTVDSVTSVAGGTIDTIGSISELASVRSVNAVTTVGSVQTVANVASLGGSPVDNSHPIAVSQSGTATVSGAVAITSMPTTSIPAEFPMMSESPAE